MRHEERRRTSVFHRPYLLWKAGTGLPVILSVVMSVAILLLSANASAGRVAAFYLEPHFGAARLILKAVEIERSFVTAVTSDASYGLTDINPEGIIAPVGRMISYSGGGVEAGFTTGVKISGLKLGFTFTWINASFTGFSKRYRYSPELMRAQGRKYEDEDTLPVFRLMGAIKYGVPIMRILLQFQTRIGRMIIRDTSLIVGRAVEEQNGMTADVGIEATMRPSRWISIGFLGYGGFFAFTGKYEGGMGGVFGGNGTLCIYF